MWNTGHAEIAAIKTKKITSQTNSEMRSRLK
jgi:hypothetical protein